MRAIMPDRMTSKLHHNKADQPTSGQCGQLPHATWKRLSFLLELQIPASVLWHKPQRQTTLNKVKKQPYNLC